MKEKLSVKKVYRNAYRYVESHIFAFIFLTIFYFLGSLLPMFFGSSSFKIISLFYTYLFFYFAAGCYFKQRLLWDKEIFLTAGLRFLTAVVLFFLSIFVATLFINFGIYFIKLIFPQGSGFVEAVFNSTPWLLGKYAFIFVLFTAFFMIPSFAFISEITGKNRSLLMTYAKTKGNFWRITAVTAVAFIMLLLVMTALTYVHVMLASLVRAAILVFVSILYFKMYDFFYNWPQNKKPVTAKTETAVKPKKAKASGRGVQMPANSQSDKENNAKKASA